MKKPLNISLSSIMSAALLLIILFTSQSLHAQIECGYEPDNPTDPFETVLWANSVTDCDPIPQCCYDVCEEVYDFVDDEEVTINLIFHIIQQNGTDNIDFSTLEEDIVSLNAYYAGEMGNNMEAANTNIQFQLATHDPNGNPLPTPGVREHFLSQPEHSQLFNGLADYEQTDRAYANFHWPNNYVNLYLINDTDAISRAGLGSPVRIKEGAFSIDNSFSVTELAHELAHYLGLHHTFGAGWSPICEVGSDDGQPADDCITMGDFVCDTQATIEQNGDLLCYSNSYIGDLQPVEYNIMTYGAVSEGFTEGQKQRMRYFLHNNLFALVNTPIGDTEITNEVTYTGNNLFVDGIIRVKDNGKLTFDGTTVFFTPRSRIYVEAGGVLHVKECSYLSSIYEANTFYPDVENILMYGPADSDILWDGIVVYGVGNQSGPISVDDPGFMGLVRVENSTIAFANEAIANYNGLSEDITKPGIIQAVGSNFFNNYNSIHINSHRYSSFSHQVKDCLFTQSQNFLNFYMPDFKPYEYLIPIDKFQLIVRNSNNFEITGNHFYNSPIFPLLDLRGIKI